MRIDRIAISPKGKFSRNIAFLQILLLAFLIQLPKDAYPNVAQSGVVRVGKTL